MRVSFRLTRRDLFFASLQAQFHQPFLVVFYVLLLLLTSCMFWQVSSPENGLLARLITVVILELIPIMGIIALVGLQLFFSIISGQNKTLLTEQSIVLDHSFLTFESEYSRSEVRWKAVQRIIRTRSYLFLYLSQLGACIIPRRAFDSKEQWNSFFNFCQAQRQPA